MTYTAKQIATIYQRTRKLNPNMAPLGKITEVISQRYNDEVQGFSYNCRGPKGTVTVHLWCCPNSMELVASCDY